MIDSQTAMNSLLHLLNTNQNSLSNIPKNTGELEKILEKTSELPEFEPAWENCRRKTGI